MRDRSEKPPEATTPPHFKALTFDWRAYEKYLDDDDLTDEQKRQCLETLWELMVAFVDLGFNIHPVQQAGHGSKDGDFTGDSSGGCGLKDDLSTLNLLDVIASMPIPEKTTFNNAADDTNTPRRKGKES